MNSGAPAHKRVPVLILRIEGAVIFVACILLFRTLAIPLWLFFVLLLVPDLGILGYAFGPRTGSICYNLLHSYAPALLIGVAGTLLGSPALLALGLIWAGHIGIDRALGFGLKYGDAFKHTHLQEV